MEEETSPSNRHVGAINRPRSPRRQGCTSSHSTTREPSIYPTMRFAPLTGYPEEEKTSPSLSSQPPIDPQTKSESIATDADTRVTRRRRHTQSTASVQLPSLRRSGVSKPGLPNRLGLLLSICIYLHNPYNPDQLCLSIFLYVRPRTNFPRPSLPMGYLGEKRNFKRKISFS